jgi:hypothetical protein
MPAPRMKLAKVDEAGLKKIKALEKKLGLHIVALEVRYHPAHLSPKVLHELQTLERELDTILVAYKKD